MIATVLQAVGALVVAIGVGLLLGVGAGLVVAGVAAVAFGIAQEIG
jgi:hypothetical protein